MSKGNKELEKASRKDHLNGDNHDEPSNFRVASFQTNQYDAVVPTFTLQVGSSPAVMQGDGEGPLSGCVNRSVLRFGCHDSGCFLDVCWFFSVSFQSCSYCG